ncbi:MAG TPA: alpha/beta fold hydrolase [Candidatus Dormibacteraeota bacterium]|jgi:pimeloyl-ACP methyl ester carboxylesterase|nr:alpha/beta fold hydrolase [Candidatus Dormibacteraeota bacterium]
MSIARHGEIELAYDRVGPPQGEPLLFILGVGVQLIACPDQLCAALVERGFQVARFDNRDVGLSTHLTAAGRPSRLGLVLKPSSAAAYGLDDLADDAVAVLDALAWRQAHIVGISQGGMTAQRLAVRHPDRVLTLTSISSSPSPAIGRLGVRTMVRAVAAARRPIRSAEDCARHFVDLQPVIGSPAYPVDEESLRDLGRATYRRGHDQAGVERQSSAFQSSGDRAAELAAISAPTLVIHGEADRLVRPVGGRATAEAIPGARLVMIPGMGHDLPRELWPRIVDEIAATARVAPAESR